MLLKIEPEIGLKIDDIGLKIDGGRRSIRLKISDIALKIDCPF